MFQRRLKRLGMVGNMTSTPISYWQPGSEERRLRIFISHRYDRDQALYSEVISDLNSQSFHVQDMSLSARQLMAGPRGGELPTLKIQAEIAARIYTSDILIAPSRVGAGQAEWVTWEVQLAAVGYAIPILFVDHSDDQQRRNTLVSDAAAVGVKHAVCGRRTPDIVRNVIDLVGGRPNWGVRENENDKLIRYRGPLPESRDTILTKFPFEPRLTAVDPEPPKPKGMWPFK